MTQGRHAVSLVTMHASLLLLVSSAVLFAPVAAATAVNRCVQDGQVVYTDQACPGARVVELQPGAAVPDARERLRRDQDALDAGAAARRAALAHEAALARMQGASAPDTPPTAQVADDAVYDFAY